MNWLALTPEYALIGGLLINIVICAIKDSGRLVHQAFGLSLAVAWLLCVFDVQAVQAAGLLITESMRALQAIVLLAAGLFWYLSQNQMLDHLYRPSNILLIQSSLIGLIMLMIAQDLLNIYIALELMSLPLYAMAAIRIWDKASLEGALKYFVTGAMASALLLLGFALLYAITGSIDLGTIGLALKEKAGIKLFSPDMWMLLGGLSVAFMVAGCSFKLGLFPFHSWMPDVYQSARIDVVLWVATLPKIAIAVMMLKLIIATSSFIMYWQSMLLLVGLVSVAFGNLMALAQNNYRRLMAYSSIAHMGFFALAMYVMSPEGMAGGLFYMLVYILMSFITLGVILHVDRSEFFEIGQMRALMSVPQMAVVLMAGIFSLAGIPPFAGFMAKLSIFSSLIQVNNVGVAIAGILLSVIALGYYLKMVKMMYFKEEETPVIAIRAGRISMLMLFGLTLCLLYIGILPNQLMVLTQAVVSQNLFL
ncbi:MAG: NADH-quinone oxidoreductase subunit N [Gammaproteobacteria bacterium]|nr:NADH-quinone oxidoreductase subunit N [Gammaproteobacteria bacterium]